MMESNDKENCENSIVSDSPIIVTDDTDISIDQPCKLIESSPFQPFLRHDFLTNIDGIVTPRALLHSILHIIFHFELYDLENIEIVKCNLVLHNLLRCTSIHIADLPAKVVSNLEVIFPVSRVRYDNEIDITDEFLNILEHAKKRNFVCNGE